MDIALSVPRLAAFSRTTAGCMLTALACVASQSQLFEVLLQETNLRHMAALLNGFQMHNYVAFARALECLLRYGQLTAVHHGDKNRVRDFFVRRIDCIRTLRALFYHMRRETKLAYRLFTRLVYYVPVPGLGRQPF